MKIIGEHLSMVIVGMIFGFLSEKSFSDPDMTTLYVSSRGDDSNSGLTPGQALATLQEANDRLVASHPNTPITVFLAPGTYSGQTVRWTYSNGKSITIQSPTPGRRAEFQPCRFPTIDGCLNDKTFFSFRQAPGALTYITLKWLRISYYLTAIELVGDRSDPLDQYNGANRILDNQFIRIGLKFPNQGVSPSTAALRFVASRENVVHRNSFIDCGNNPVDTVFHNIYVAHGSSDNLITQNIFNSPNAQSVNLRDQSHDNLIQGNSIEAAYASAISEWYCSPETTPNPCTSPNIECPSHGNSFVQNTLYRGIACNTYNTFLLYGPSERPGCPVNFPMPRLRTSDNELRNYCPNGRLQTDNATHDSN